MIEIDQEELCKCCIDALGTDRARCEGSKCGEAEDIYLEQTGISILDGNCFNDVNAGDKLFIVQGDELASLPVRRLSKFEDKVAIVFGDQEYECVAKAKASVCINYAVFIDKKDAVEYFEKSVSDKLIKMAKCLAKFV